MASEKKKRVLIPVGKGSSLFQTACLFSTLGKFGAHVFIASVDDILCEMSEGAKVCARMYCSNMFCIICDVVFTFLDCHFSYRRICIWTKLAGQRMAGI